jgi:hypothetical protein
MAVTDCRQLHATRTRHIGRVSIHRARGKEHRTTMADEHLEQLKKGRALGIEAIDRAIND